MKFLGIEIGGTKLQLVIGNQRGEIHDRHRLTVDRAAGGEGIRAQIAATLPELIAAHSPVAVGVGFGGPVDWRTGRICCSHQIAGWHDFELGEWLRQQTSLPVFVDNDANVAALGEALHGAGRGFNPVFWINMGSGVGGGLVVDGRLYHGATPGEAEIGHVRLDKSGTILEQRCSGWAVDQRIREAVAALKDDPETAFTHSGVELPGAYPASSSPGGEGRGEGGRPSILASLVRAKTLPGGEARHLAPALAANDPLATRLLAEVADDLAFALSHVVQLFHPEIVVVGGGLSLVGEPLRAAIAAALPRYVMDSFQPGLQIALAGLGEDSVPIGALALTASNEVAAR